MIFLTLILGFVLRLISLNQSLWLDEAIGALAIKNYSFLCIFDFVKGDNHPPLYYLLLKAWSMIFGYSEVSLRFPSIVFGIAAIFLVYLIVKKLLKNEKLALITSLLLATSGLHIYYSQEARMYVLAAFFATLSIYSLVTNRFILFSFSILSLVATDYMPAFLLPAFFVYGFWEKKEKDWWKKFLLSFIPLAVFGILWLPILGAQSQGGRWLLSILPSWREVAGGATFKQLILFWSKFVFGRISLINKATYLLLVSLASIPALVGITLSLRNYRKLKLLVLWFFVPLALGFLASLAFPAFIYFRYIFILPAFYILIMFGLFSLKNKFLKYGLILTVLVLNLIGTVIYYVDSRQQREMWRQAVSFIEGGAKKDDIAILDYPEPFAPYRWYSKGKVIAVGVADSIFVDQTLTEKRTKEAIKGKNGIYYFEYLVDLTDPTRIVEKTIEKEGFEVSKVYADFVGVGQVKYFVR